MITKINIKIKLKKIIRYKIKKKSNQNKTNFFLKDIQIRSIIKAMNFCLIGNAVIVTI